jgi:uncharacterized protein YuzE
MRVTYSPDVDAAYIYLVDVIGAGKALKTYPCDPEAVGGTINLDFDETGQLLGIEVLGARRLLPASLLSQAG